MKQSKKEPDLRVRDCLVWKTPESSSSKKQGKRGQESKKSPKQEADRPPSEQPPRHRPQKADVGKATSRGYDTPVEVHKQENDEGTVIEALRGWPRDRKVDGALDYLPECGDPEEHRATNEDLAQYMARAELEEKHQGSAHNRSARSQRGKQDKAGIKSNKTAMLRQMKQEERILAQNKPLWKMSKFTKTAKPHISSFRTDEEKKSMRGPCGGSRGSKGDRSPQLPPADYGYTYTDHGNPDSTSAYPYDCNDGLYGADYRHFADSGEPGQQSTGGYDYYEV